MSETIRARLSLVTLVVDDYDAAIRHYRDDLGFHLAEDTPLPDGKRWVVAQPGDASGCGLLLARAETPDQKHAIGQQAGGRVGFFLEVTDFDEAYARMRMAGVQFEEEPREEVYAKVAVFRDAYGNRWDLLCRRT